MRKCPTFNSKISLICEISLTFSLCELLVPTNLFTSFIYCLIPILVFILDDGSLLQEEENQEEQEEATNEDV